MRSLPWLAFAFAIGAGALSCIDPQQADSVDALGPEVAGIREGPRHRAGQPCTVCHGGGGPGSPDFAAAGTVYDRRASATALENVTVVLTDSAGSTFSTVTNDVGNFYVETSRWSPLVPITVELHFGAVKKEMKTRIGRDGGCGACHRGTGDSAHMPAVYLRELADP